jgi:hypothetical protein
VATKSGSDGESQHAKFVETARALGCDEDKERFEAVLGKIATHRPPRENPPKPGRKKKENERAK